VSGYRDAVPVLASIPSPTQSVWHLGPFPVRAYALCIVLGIVVAVWLTTRRFRERGGDPDHVWDVAAWAVVLGIIGGRLYHVITDPELYFDPGRHPIDALKIWDGGLGIWGAVILGALGVWIGCRRRGIRFASFADACIPGVVFAQAIGRWGNWFNNELYGGPTSVPWRLEIHDIDVATGHAQACTFGHLGAQVCGYYQPTFLYESIWDVAVGVALLVLDRRLRLGRGNVVALYVMGYTAGRGWIEALRTDHANHILGLRLNDWTAIIAFALALLYFVRHGGFHARREPSAYRSGDPAEVAAGPDPGDRVRPDGTMDGDTDGPDRPEPRSNEEVGADAGRERSADRSAGDGSLRP
jgi:prolipoprotein diacylglyceryl transferase